MRLVEIGALPDDSDLSLWEASCETITHQISLKLARKEGGLMDIFNAVVASLPRKSDVFRYSAILSKQNLEKAHQKLIEKITEIIPILVESGWKKSPDYQKNSLIDCFSLLEESEAVRIFQKAQESRTITEDDVDEYFVLFDKKFDRLLRRLEVEMVERLRRSAYLENLGALSRRKSFISLSTLLSKENLVPMATSKKYSALNSLKISEADKVAIRPTYDKYRYETPNSDEEGNGRGVYDDEYDDEFDGREFKMERLNRGVSSGGHRGGRGETTTSGASKSSERYTGGRDR
ncbi:hypothetical protein GCK72_008156 [Caenorhabditis remanei]|uniref:Uncharacterized protein n=1 Tax=Caenorhabditis remanei TaxID=31234 RepID=A0A6A5GYV9_CAERE|nr:hypothetical protein GCK72_008156 [Caenorhabditis remanei]KAF1759911.1 hypothetical protein GCK72_008156 [Caenorhabditis remanei]